MTVYVVRPGDTLGGIAKRHGITLREILRLNPQISNSDLIARGSGTQLTQ
jgi:LysM repeat protein